MTPTPVGALINTPLNIAPAIVRGPIRNQLPVCGNVGETTSFGPLNVAVPTACVAEGG
jgi:hypothetical protein